MGRPFEPSAAAFYPFEPLPPGDYACVVREVKELPVDNGDPSWRITLKTTEGERAGHRIYDRLVPSEPDFRAKLEALGIDISDGMELVPDMLEGRRVVLTTDHDAKGYTRIVEGGYARAPEPDSGTAAEYTSQPMSGDPVASGSAPT